MSLLSRTVPSVLRNPAFRNLWLGQAISQIGDSLYYVSFMFMVKKFTGRDDMVGYVGAVEMVPFFLFGLYTGVLADRMDRRVILLWSDLLCGIFLVPLGILGLMTDKPPVWTLFVVAFMLSTVRAFFFPTKNATIPAIVPEHELASAMSLSMATESFMRIGGLAVSVFVLAGLYSLSPQMFFVAVVLLNALSFFLSAVFVYRLPAVIPERKEGDGGSVSFEFMEGLRYVLHRPVLLTMRITGTLFSLMVAPFFVVYVASNDAWFGGKPQTLAINEGMFFLGMLLTSSVVGKMKIRRPGLSFCWALMVVGLGVGLMAFSRQLWLFAALNLVCGLAVPFADIPMNTYIQLAVPDAIRGRVNSLQMMTSTAVMPIGMVLGGVLIKSFGLVDAFLCMGFGMVLATLTGLASRPFRQAEMPATALADPPAEAVPA